MTPAAAVDAYLAGLSDQRRLSAHTISNYRRDLGKLLAVAGDLPLDRIDTLKITTTITGDQPWYDTFLTGFITAVLAVAGVIGAFAL